MVKEDFKLVKEMGSREQVSHLWFRIIDLLKIEKE